MVDWPRSFDKDQKPTIVFVTEIAQAELIVHFLDRLAFFVLREADGSVIKYV